ncbi:MAG: hypothetical protein H0T40_08815 [Geodermatophilaceae bacterium]|nr:hypothetical protein [Geodermatophilaceae bacterium]
MDPQLAADRSDLTVAAGGIYAVRMQPEAIIDSGRARRAAVGLLVFAATLPLQWQEVTGTPVGAIRYFHLGAVAMVLLARPDWVVLRQLRGVASPAVFALCVMTAIGTITELMYGEFSGQSLQHLVYGIAGLFVAGAVMTAMAHPAGRALLLWTGPVATSSFIVVFTIAGYSLGLDPIGAASQSLLHGNPDQMSATFRAVFATTSGLEEARSNTRHEIFAALLATLYVSWATARSQRLTHLILVPTTVVVAALVAVSLSRSIWLAAGLVVLAAGLRVVIRQRLNPITAMLGLALVCVSPFVASDLYDLVEERIFENTDSYETRLEAFDITGDELISRLLRGGASQDAGGNLTSTHNMIADTAFRSGILAAFAAIVLVLVFFVHARRVLRRFLNTGSVHELMAFGAAALVLVRAFTIGGGLLHQAEWFAFGLVIAMELWHRTGADKADAERSTADGTAAIRTDADRTYADRADAGRPAAASDAAQRRSGA